MTTPSADADPTVADGAAIRLELPEAVLPLRVFWPYTIVLVSMHALSLLAFDPRLFSRSGLVAAVLGHFVFGMLGITIGYHRLLTHQGFTCAKWLEHTLAVLGICTLQDSPARWVAIHRVHHKESDCRADPHSPLASLLWGHMGWLFVRSRDHDDLFRFERYVRDLLRDPFYLRLERHSAWLGIYLLHALAFVVLGAAIGWFAGGTRDEAARMAASMLVWGVVVRTVVVFHGTWIVNSLAHTWGYRNYETGDNSRNNWLVALLAHGEGWHNNHHADQRAASHGHRWWELDMSWWVIRGLESVGLVRDVVRPRCFHDRHAPAAIATATSASVDGSGTAAAASRSTPAS